MRKLAILSNAAGYGGGEKSLELLIPQLANLYRIDTFIENRDHLKRPSLINQKTKSNIIEFKEGKNILAICPKLFVLARYFVSKRPDYVWTNINKGSFFVSLLSRLLLRKCSQMIFYIRDFQWICKKFIFSRISKLSYLVFTTNTYSEYSPRWLSSKAKEVITSPIAPISPTGKSFRLDVKSLNKLYTGKGKGLDVICNGILNNHPFIYNPKL